MEVCRTFDHVATNHLGTEETNSSLSKLSEDNFK